MPLPQPQLDDKRFDALVAESTKLIPRLAPGWTDHNRHDPGITLVELFAWLAEMQQYYLNGIGSESYLKFLKLLSTSPQGAAPARTEINFRVPESMLAAGIKYGLIAGAGAKAVSVPEGTKLTNSSLQADRQLIFETGSPLLVLPINLKRILTSTRRGLADNTDANNWDGLSYFAFGEQAEVDSHLYLGFDQPFPAGEEIALTFDLAQDYAVAKGQHDAEETPPLPSALVTWEYYNAEEKWVPLEIMGTADDLPGDGTLMLSQSGRLFFNAPEDMELNKSHTFNEELLFWLRATVRQSGFEVSPRVEAISINTIDAIQVDTFSKVISYSSNGKPNQSFQGRGYLALYATSIVQVRERDGRWKDWEARENLSSSGPNDLHYVIEKDTTAGLATVTFGDGTNGRIPNRGEEGVRIISYLPEFEEERKIGGSNGLPGQSFALERTNAMAEALRIQVEERVVLPETVKETTTVSCLLDFTRTTTAKVGEPVEVVLSLTAKGDLCSVAVEENLSGGLTLIPGDLPSVKGALEGEPEQKLTFEAGRLISGSVRTWNYRLDPGEEGGSITGRMVISIGAHCPTVEAESPCSLIAVRTSRAELRWRDWSRVDDFDASGPGDPHFVFDAVSDVVMFGDGINGDIPPAGERNIRVVSLQTCNGESGNVVSTTIGKLAEPYSIDLPADLRSLQFSQVIAGTGGKSSETLADAQARAREDLRTQYQAVTSADFEFLARNTPGLRVSRVKAIPGFSFYNNPDPRASVTVVVLPFSEEAKPVPSENFLRTVCRHLDRHRLITTQIEVVPPNYVLVSVQATVMLRSGFDIEASRVTIIEALDKFLRPVPDAGDSKNQGWPFGRTVYKSEIFELIENVEGVDCVEGVSLTAQGTGAGRDKNGNITISRISVVFSGDHQVDVLTPDVECRRQRG